MVVAPPTLLAVTGRHDPARRLTFVITSLGHGGAQTQVAALAERLSGRSWDVDVVSLLGDDASPVAVRPPPAVAVTSLGMRRGVPDVRAVARLARHLRRRAPTIVHSHMLHANLLARVARPFARVPVLVCTAHNVREGGRWVDVAYRATDRACDLTTNVSPQAVARFVAVGAASERRIRYVPNGIDANASQPPLAGEERAAARAQLGVPSGRFVWLTAGRHEPQKDYGTLLDAFARARTENPDQHLLLAGDGPDRAALERHAGALGLEDAVGFLGYWTEMDRLLASVDGFVLSSLWEGLPMVLLEAGASRLPVVATRVGGTPEVVVDGATGRLVEPSDAEALGEAMADVSLRSERARTSMGDQARRHVVERFDLERIADAWERLYAELLASSGAS